MKDFKNALILLSQENAKKHLNGEEKSLLDPENADVMATKAKMFLLTVGHAEDDLQALDNNLILLKALKEYAFLTNQNL